MMNESCDFCSEIINYMKQHITKTTSEFYTFENAQNV